MKATTTHAPRGGGLYRVLIAIGLGCLALASVLGAAPAQAQTSTMLSGYVFGYDGKALENATVTVFRMPQHVAIGPGVQTNANGEWSIDTGSGTFAVRAEHAGYGPSEFTVYSTAYTTGIAFMLPVTNPTVNVPLVASISGRVVDLDGIPLGDMTIYATNAQETGIKQIAGPPTFSATSTDAAGHYTLQIPAGQVWVGIKTSAAWGYQQKPRAVTAGDSFADGDFIVAIRTGAQYVPPTSTPLALPTSTPIVNTGGVTSPEPGMPTTGQPDTNGWPALLAVGLLALLAGGLLRGRQAPR
jgi:hypothetical protein